ncbi:hypothetical protein FUA48_14055 [Flavobacterium alkalisoli]|uniref:Uncharacterized protein n=1 Tax=Flavobacterium alkalisoli TaxID=2602769 RepID=A0A5B9FUP4_9FLAO|nr:pyocin knob domain-containing protein [Flavobacterium alkalisoli]QEE50660.1 hypothetical protein FUA48_14055 [Flavobacterium alkalisoli]
MAVNLNTILNWFKTGERPTQSQFWDTWQSFWHKDEIIPQSKIENLNGSLNTKANEDVTLSDKGSIPDAADLNNYTETGLFFQKLNARAASGLNYPIAKAGKLEVTTTSGFVYQTYHAYGSYNNIYFRNRYGDTWYPWKMLSSESI